MTEYPICTSSFIFAAVSMELLSRWRYNENRDLSLRDWFLALARLESMILQQILHIFILTNMILTHSRIT